MEMNLLKDNRLVKSIYPINYNLNISPNFSDFTFDGSVIIHIIFQKDVNAFALNSKSLIIKTILLDGENMKFTEDIENEIIILRYSNDRLIISGTHSLYITYSGTLNDNMEGFYRSSYINYLGETTYLATTQFESTSARLAFPCFDEPNFKASFDVSITTDEKYTVLSNNDVDYIVSINNKNDSNLHQIKTVYFKTSPIMSTYLLAFIVGDLEYIEGFTKQINIHNAIHVIQSKRIRVYGVKGNKEKMTFALDIGIRCLEWYMEWFGIDYPLSKLDMVAIPDFSAGAMENWGLVTYREGLLYCDQDTDLSEKQDISVTICHELAHQWFGNLVTMEWWTYLWLNESMATYFGWRVTDELFPEWKVWNKFNEQEYSSALELDSLESSHPIEVPIKNTNEIQNIFDAISYSKGSCLVKFLAEHLGENIFRNGMIHYMKKNAYKNTESADLWKSFDQISGKNISGLMESWIKQTGYPVITVTNNMNTLLIKQEKFLKQGPTSDKGLWQIPLVVIFDGTNQSYNYNTLMASRELDLTNISKSQHNHVLVNKDRSAFYRVKYTNTPKLTNCSLQEITNILDDSFALAYSGYHGFSAPFNIMTSLDFNHAYYPFWYMFTGYLSSLDNLTLNTKTNIRVKNMISYYSRYISNILNNLGWEQKEGETSNDTDLREVCLSFLAKNDDENIVNIALNMFRSNNWTFLKNIVIPIIGKHGSENDYKKLIELHNATTNAQIKESLMRGIASVKSEKLIKLSLDLIFSGIIRNQDICAYSITLITNTYATNIMRNFIYDNWLKFTEKYSQGSSEILHMTKIAGIQISSHNEFEVYKKIFSNPLPGTEQAVNQTIEKIQSRLGIINRILSDSFFI